MDIYPTNVKSKHRSYIHVPESVGGDSTSLSHICTNSSSLCTQTYWQRETAEKSSKKERYFNACYLAINIIILSIDFLAVRYHERKSIEINIWKRSVSVSTIFSRRRKHPTNYSCAFWVHMSLILNSLESTIDLTSGCKLKSMFSLEWSLKCHILLTR